MENVGIEGLVHSSLAEIDFCGVDCDPIVNEFSQPDNSQSQICSCVCICVLVICLNEMEWMSDSMFFIAFCFAIKESNRLDNE